MKSMKNFVGVLFSVKLSQISRCSYLLGAGKTSLNSVWLSLDKLCQPALRKMKNNEKWKTKHDCLVSLCQSDKAIWGRKSASPLAEVAQSMWKHDFFKPGCSERGAGMETLPFLRPGTLSRGVRGKLGGIPSRAAGAPPSARGNAADRAHLENSIPDCGQSITVRWGITPGSAPASLGAPGPFSLCNWVALIPLQSVLRSHREKKKTTTKSWESSSNYKFSPSTALPGFQDIEEHTRSGMFQSEKTNSFTNEHEGQPGNTDLPFFQHKILL